MSYFLRILSPSAEPLSVAPIVNRLRAKGLTDVGLACAGEKSAWDSLLLRQGGAGNVIAEVERLLVRPGSPGEADLGMLVRLAEKAQPLSAAAWLASFLPSVRTVWGFNIYAGLNEEGGWAALGAVKDAIWSAAGGIQYVTDEGFTNEESYQITWEFAPGTTGSWWMALIKEGTWERFKADLGDPIHRTLFQAGQVPPGCQAV